MARAVTPGMANAPHFLLRSPLSAAILAAVLLQSPTANACACCDGYSVRRIVGWSESGRTALVEADTVVACDRTTALEMWRVDVPVPVGCFDLHGDPDARVACDAIMPAYDGEAEADRPLRVSHRKRFYPRVPSALPSDRVRVGTRRLHDPDGYDVVEMTVSVLAGGRWRPVWSGVVTRGHVEDQRDGSSRRLPLEATVWPAPSGDRALLVITGHDTMAGIGHFDTSLVWIGLPSE